MYKLRVTNFNDVELDLKEFETEKEARDYILYEWSDTDCLTEILECRGMSCMKDHEIAQLVNELTAIAKNYHGHDCLREKISKLIVPVLKQK